MQPFYPRTMVLDPDVPLLLSSDPDYSSSSETFCDGPGGLAISHRELSDNEGQPPIVPIIPSLNKKPVKDAPRSDGDHFKCNTFAELQERMDCIYGRTEGKAIRAATTRAQTGTLNSTEPPSPHKSARKSSDGFLERTTVCMNKPDQEHLRFSLAVSFMDASSSTNEKKLSATLCQSCGMKPIAAYPQDSEVVLQEKHHLKEGVPKLLASPSSPRPSRAAAQPEQVVSWTPPPGMSHQVLRQGQQVSSLPTERVPGVVEVSSLQPTALGNCSDRSFLRTTVTFQQSIDLNGEDELVFTVVEELPCGHIKDNSHPSNLISFNTDCSLQASSSSSQPVSIIGCINDEYDVYTAKQGTVGSAADEATDCQEIMFSQYGHMQSVVSPAKSEGNPLTNRDNNIVTENPSLLTSQRLFLKQYSVMSSLDNSSCYSESDRSHTSSNHPADTKCPPSQSHSLNTSGLAHIPPPAARPIEPQKTKPTLSATVGCRQDSDPREVEYLSASKPPRDGMSVSSKRHSVSQPPKASSLSQRVIDSCERTSSWRQYTLIKLPRLTQGAETLGTVSSQQSSRSKWGPVGTLVKGTLKFSSIGKKSNGEKSIMSSKSGNFCPSLAQLVTQSIQGPTTTNQSKSAFKTSHNTERSTISEEEFNIRIQADSFTHRVSSVKTECSSAKTSSSLKSRRVKAEPYRNYRSRFSLKRCDSQMLSGTRPELLRENHGATLKVNIRSAPRHKAPSFTAASASQYSPGATTVKVLGRVKGHSSRVPPSDGSNVRTLSTCSTKSQSSSPKPVDVTRQNPGLVSAGQSLLGTGAKMGRGRAANSKVSELAAVSQREQQSRVPGVTGNDATESRKCSVSRSPINTLLPSPYSKITAPRRPQRHSSDNSSILSGEKLPTMGHTALFHHSGGSSGYESIIRDGETTGSTSSAHDSMSETGESSSLKSKVSKSPNKRGNGGWAAKNRKTQINSSKLIFQV